MKIINIICISLFTSLLTMSIAHSDGHIKLEYFATAKLFLDPLAPVADRDIIANVPTEGSYIETADGERWNIHMKTVSEKYSWINNTMFVGEMVEMQFFNDKGKRPYVMYKWYAVK